MEGEKYQFWDDIAHIKVILYGFVSLFPCQLYIRHTGSAAKAAALLFALTSNLEYITNLSCYNLILHHILWLRRAAEIPKAKGGGRLQMKLVYNHLAPLFLYFLNWIDCSCTYFLPRFLNPFHILIYKVWIESKVAS